MSGNSINKIINAINPGKESKEPTHKYESPNSEAQQPSDSSYTETEDNIEYSEASEEPSPDFQEAVNPAHPHQCQNWQDFEKSHS
jgi:hypothetical protein